MPMHTDTDKTYDFVCEFGGNYSLESTINFRRNFLLDYFPVACKIHRLERCRQEHYTNAMVYVHMNILSATHRKAFVVDGKCLFSAKMAAHNDKTQIFTFFSWIFFFSPFRTQHFLAAQLLSLNTATVWSKHEYSGAKRTHSHTSTHRHNFTVTKWQSFLALLSCKTASSVFGVSINEI